MKWLISILLVLMAAVSLALLAHQDPGFVVIGRGPWTLETSLFMFGFLLLCSLGLLYFLARAGFLLWQLPERWQHSRRSRLHGRAQLALQQGVSALAEGAWTEAERTLLRSYPQYLHYLGAAYAAQQAQRLERRDEYLEQAHNNAPAEYRLMVNLLQADLQLAAGQYSLALATIKPLQAQAPKHPRVLALLLRIYQGLHNWYGLWELLPELRKRKVLSDSEVDALEISTAVALLHLTVAQSTLAATTTWERLPKTLRLKPAVTQVYVKHLAQEGQLDQADTLLRDSLKLHWDADSVLLYAELSTTNASQQLNRAEAWLKGRERDPVLLLALGKLCMRNRLWGKAQQYLEAALGIAPSTAVYQALGDLLNQLGETGQAAEQYRKGLLSLNAAKSSNAPLPDATPQAGA